MSDNKNLSCNFCRKSHAKVRKLIASDDGYSICNECVEVCNEILDPKGKSLVAVDSPELPSPKSIKEFLDHYVIGQDHTKTVLSVAVYNHYKRLNNPIVDGVELEKSNILLCGPSGVGKTLLAQTIARMLDVPFAMTDATGLTEAGYIGDDVEGIIARLLSAAKNDVKLAERGIIFIDEIDKKRNKDGGAASRDVSGEGVQQALLKLLEGSEVYVAPAGGRRSSSEPMKINTKNILFIVAGAFVGMDKIVEKHAKTNASSIGFGSVSASDRAKKKLTIEQDHLINFGIIPELVGRLPIISTLEDLDESQLVRVLTEPKNAIVKQFAGMFKLDGIQLEFSERSLGAVAKIAKTRKTGGRALRSILEEKLLSLQFDLPDLRRDGVRKVVITEGVIENGDAPEFVREEIKLLASVNSNMSSEI